ncbi:cytochrome c family protein [Henriciella sp.]|uniref:c-type cytochrome n=1 Tax=Henriciella sp. TaxID=1968823 RepID=UPI002629E2F0|nr:cytochrome c family protein [Henriciella sp.]
MKPATTMAALMLGLAVMTGCGGADEPAGDTSPEEIRASEENADQVDGENGSAASQASSEEGATEEGSSQFSELPAPYTSADYAAGKRVFKQCSTCHTLDEGGPAVMGPNLYGVFGREAGAREGFGYSKALQEADFTWTPDKLDEWLTNPRKFLPGNRMSFSGVRRPDDRTAVIAYIMAETGYEPS